MSSYSPTPPVVLQGQEIRSDPSGPATAAIPQPFKLIEDQLSARLTRADRHAIDRAKRYRTAYTTLFICSAFAVLCAALPVALGWGEPGHPLYSLASGWPLAETALIVLIGIVYWRARKADWHHEWLKSRQKAEFLRYLPVALPILDADQLKGVADSLGERETVDLVQNVANPLPRGQPDSAFFWPRYLEQARQICKDQIKYHEQTRQREHALVHRAHAISLFLFGCTFAAALGHLFTHNGWLTVITTFFPAAAAALHGFVAQRESQRISRRSKRMAQALRSWVEEAERTEPADEDTIRRLGADLSQLLLGDVEEWHALLAHQELHLG